MHFVQCSSDRNHARLVSDRNHARLVSDRNHALNGCRICTLSYYHTKLFIQAHLAILPCSRYFEKVLHMCIKFIYYIHLLNFYVLNSCIELLRKSSIYNTIT